MLLSLVTAPCAPRAPRQRQQSILCYSSHAGFLLDFVSCPVIKGFTSAASITIGFNQVKVGAQLCPTLLEPCWLLSSGQRFGSFGAAMLPLWLTKIRLGAVV